MEAQNDPMIDLPANTFKDEDMMYKPIFSNPPLYMKVDMQSDHVSFFSDETIWDVFNFGQTFVRN